MNQPKPDKKFDLTVVVSGQAVQVTFNHNQTVRRLVEKSLHESGRAGYRAGTRQRQGCDVLVPDRDVE